MKEAVVIAFMGLIAIDALITIAGYINLRQELDDLKTWIERSRDDIIDFALSKKRR